ncbi:hypothetical protein R3P38DRAFT_162232 [Favolaschia claudopus]|uniref:Uncharacterized protein n=1 Tax=Favolaschia claudopus TaxID=2862362 RepID=A0AAW0CZZ1_9AGAR
MTSSSSSSKEPSSSQLGKKPALSRLTIGAPPPTSPSSSPNDRRHIEYEASTRSPQARRRRRTSSPPIMFGAGMYDLPAPKPPRPLIKLDKKQQAASATPPNSPSIHSPSRTNRWFRRTRTPAPSPSTQLSAPISAVIHSPTTLSDSVRAIDAALNTGGYDSERPLPTTPLVFASFYGQYEDDSVSSLQDSTFSRPESSSLDEEFFDDSNWMLDDLGCDSETRAPSPIHFAEASRPISFSPHDALHPTTSSFDWAHGHGGAETRPNTPLVPDSMAAFNTKILSHYCGGASTRSTAKERWIGEWNEDDMQEVIRKLRSLRSFT